MTVGTTHMSYTRRFVDTPRKKQEVDRLVECIDGHKTGYILAGDLNSRPRSYAVRSIAKHLQHAGPPVDHKTWTTKPFSHQGFAEEKLDWRLDYVFASAAIEVLAADVLETEFSDHLPILVTVNLARPGVDR